MNDIDKYLLRTAIAIALSARQHGNHPFGALLADEQGNVLLRAENTVNTARDCTGHAETNLMREASKLFPPSTLASCTLYSSTEPCPMCSGAVFWGNVSRVVFALSQENLYAITGYTPNRLLLSCKEIFKCAGRHVEVVGPALEDEARKVHEDFWNVKRLVSG